MRGEEATQSVSQVNLLASLIRWVSVARREIGIEQLPVFLDTYAISGHLPPEVEGAIMRLAEVVDTQPVEWADVDRSEAWSRLILGLHGILTGGPPLRPSEQFLDRRDESKSRLSATKPKGANESELVESTTNPSGDNGHDTEPSVAGHMQW